MKRGALIVIEGIDRTGKSTQSKALVENLKKNNIKAEYTNFPARTTDIGQVINSYLSSREELADEAIHLLFSANRWEKAHYIIDTLKKGVTMVVDRYCYSGVAFSAAKGLDIDWCKMSDVGLPKPDRVFFLSSSLSVTRTRDGFGQERYEVLAFQEKVAEIYEELREDNWETINADRPLEVIEAELLEKTYGIIADVTRNPIGAIWTKPTY